ncbi:MAG: GNAT family N-acetyltransferase [Candidatus Zixiibacteriota bacterium]
MNFRPATKNDLKTVMSWIPDAETCLIWAGPKIKFPLKLKQLHQAIEFEKTHTYSFDDENKLLAFGQIRIFENNRGHLSRIIVNPASRGQGIGRLFCKKLINEAKILKCQIISLNVVKDNSIAKSLYKKLGFIIPSKRPAEIRENIIYMERGKTNRN